MKTQTLTQREETIYLDRFVSAQRAVKLCDTCGILNLLDQVGAPPFEMDEVAAQLDALCKEKGLAESKNFLCLDSDLFKGLLARLVLARRGREARGCLPPDAGVSGNTCDAATSTAGDDGKRGRNRRASSRWRRRRGMDGSKRSWKWPGGGAPTPRSSQAASSATGVRGHISSGLGGSSSVATGMPDARSRDSLQSMYSFLGASSFRMLNDVSKQCDLPHVAEEVEKMLDAKPSFRTFRDLYAMSDADIPAPQELFNEIAGYPPSHGERPRGCVPLHHIRPYLPAATHSPQDLDNVVALTGVLCGATIDYDAFVANIYLPIRAVIREPHIGTVIRGRLRLARWLEQKAVAKCAARVARKDALVMRTANAKALARAVDDLVDLAWMTEPVLPGLLETEWASRRERKGPMSLSTMKTPSSDSDVLRAAEPRVFLVSHGDEKPRALVDFQRRAMLCALHRLLYHTDAPDAMDVSPRESLLEYVACYDDAASGGMSPDAAASTPPGAEVPCTLVEDAELTPGGGEGSCMSPAESELTALCSPGIHGQRLTVAAAPQGGVVSPLVPELFTPRSTYTARSAGGCGDAGGAAATNADSVGAAAAEESSQTQHPPLGASVSAISDEQIRRMMATVSDISGHFEVSRISRSASCDAEDAASVDSSDSFFSDTLSMSNNNNNINSATDPNAPQDLTPARSSSLEQSMRLSCMRSSVSCATTVHAPAWSSPATGMGGRVPRWGLTERGDGSGTKPATTCKPTAPDEAEARVDEIAREAKVFALNLHTLIAAATAAEASAGRAKDAGGGTWTLVETSKQVVELLSQDGDDGRRSGNGGPAWAGTASPSSMRTPSQHAAPAGGESSRSERTERTGASGQVMSPCALASTPATPLSEMVYVQQQQQQQQGARWSGDVVPLASPLSLGRSQDPAAPFAPVALGVGRRQDGGGDGNGRTKDRHRHKHSSGSGTADARAPGTKRTVDAHGGSRGLSPDERIIRRRCAPGHRASVELRKREPHVLLREVQERLEELTQGMMGSVRSGSRSLNSSGAGPSDGSHRPRRRSTRRDQSPRGRERERALQRCSAASHSNSNSNYNSHSSDRSAQSSPRMHALNSSGRGCMPERGSGGGTLVGGAPRSVRRPPPLPLPRPTGSPTEAEIRAGAVAPTTATTIATASPLFLEQQPGEGAGGDESGDHALTCVEVSMDSGDWSPPSEGAAEDVCDGDNDDDEHIYTARHNFVPRPPEPGAAGGGKAVSPRSPPEIVLAKPPSMPPGRAAPADASRPGSGSVSRSVSGGGDSSSEGQWTRAASPQAPAKQPQPPRTHRSPHACKSALGPLEFNARQGCQSILDTHRPLPTGSPRLAVRTAGVDPTLAALEAICRRPQRHGSPRTPGRVRSSSRSRPTPPQDASVKQRWRQVRSQLQHVVRQAGAGAVSTAHPPTSPAPPGHVEFML